MIGLIVATDTEFGIGKNGQIPWYYTEDLKYFSKTTRGSTCIMGRITAEDIAKSHDNTYLLPKRQCIVVTKDSGFTAKDAIVANSISDAITKAKSDNIFIIGGAGMYRESLPLIDEAYITVIPGKHGCDVKIPEVIKYITEEFDCVSEITSPTGLVFVIAKRKT